MSQLFIAGLIYFSHPLVDQSGSGNGKDSDNNGFIEKHFGFSKNDGVVSYNDEYFWGINVTSDSGNGSLEHRLVEFILSYEYFSGFTSNMIVLICCKFNCFEFSKLLIKYPKNYSYNGQKMYI